MQRTVDQEKADGHLAIEICGMDVTDLRPLAFSHAVVDALLAWGMANERAVAQRTARELTRAIEIIKEQEAMIAECDRYDEFHKRHAKLFAAVRAAIEVGTPT